MKCQDKKNSLLNLTTFILIGAIMISLLRVKSIEADLSNFINATVKISICGNEIIEGGEDCEGDNLNGQTCESLGYSSGTLTCDIACSFDTYSCVAPTPTPTPTVTPTPSPTSTPTPTSTPSPTPTPTLVPTATSTPGQSPTSTPGPTNTPTPITTTLPISTPTPKPALPPAIQVFDIKGTGKISLTEVFDVVKIWVDDWKQAMKEEIAQSSGTIINTGRGRKCDINNDSRCDLKDLSVLLFYVER